MKRLPIMILFTVLFLTITWSAQAYIPVAVEVFRHMHQNQVNHRTGALVRKGLPLTEESRIIWPWFDGQGRNLRKESALTSPAMTHIMEFGYDTMGNLTSVDYPDGFVTANYSYGAATHLLTGVSVTGSGGTFNLATSLSHNSAGGLESVTFGNGFITTVTPDVRNRPATWVTGFGPDDLLNNDFVYDAFGNIAEIGSDDYGYDNLNRLTTSTVNGTSFGYSYDSVGNIETVTKGGSPVGSFDYNNNKIVALLPSGYDADGNLIDDGVNTYVYDALSQTASVTNSGGTVSYKYDALGKRISANDGSVDTVYAYLGEQLIAEYTGVDYTNSVFLEGQLLARVTDNGVDTTTVRYAHLNHLGSPVAFTDSTANVVWPEQAGGTPYEIHNYEPFGADFDDIGTPALSPQDVRYTGKLLESETGKHYFNARYLNAVTDSAAPELPPRFLSPDIVIGTPDSPQSWNRYASCLNNPVRYVDPDGKIAWDLFIDIPAAGYGAYKLATEPSWSNALGFGLDVVGLLPVVPAVGLAYRAGKAIDKTSDVVRGLDKVADSKKLLTAGKLADHHIFPRQFSKWFKSRGIENIDEFTVTIGQTTHLKGVHGKGLGDLPGKGINVGWNL